MSYYGLPSLLWAVIIIIIFIIVVVVLLRLVFAVIAIGPTAFDNGEVVVSIVRSAGLTPGL